MANRKIAVIGADGQLGFDLARVLGKSNQVIRFTRRDFDVSDQDAVLSFIGGVQPDAVINTAAFHKVEECEVNPRRSFDVNGLGAYYLASAAAQNGASIIYISTDYVFGGEKKTFEESDCPNPLNVYGTSKLAGEQLTKIANPRYYIIRTSALFGINTSGKGYNFVTLMLKLAAENQEIKVVDDQFTSPTYTLDLAEKIQELIKRPAPFGIYHITNYGGCSWFDFAKKIFELKKLNPDLKAIKTADRPAKLTRPSSTILSNKALEKSGLALLRPWPEALQDYLEKIPD